MTMHIVVDGMFGSCGKGHLAAQLSKRAENPLVIRTGGPNAGHTVVREDGITFKLRCLPTAVVTNPDAVLALAAGSVIDPIILKAELDLFPDAKIWIDPAATILEPHHIEAERDTHPTAMGSFLQGWSTQKGIGAARIERLARRGKIARDWDWSGLGNVGVSQVELMVRDWVFDSDVIIETAQGYGLGLHTDYYPKTTSSDCRAIDALADVGFSPWSLPRDEPAPQVWVALRPYPIRVAGQSGPLFNETTWEELGLPPERTTVTNKIRRVGHWDSYLVDNAIHANGGPADNVHAVLMMADQVVPELAGMTSAHQIADLVTEHKHQAWDQYYMWVRRVEVAGAKLQAIGTGPDTMVFMGEWA